MPSTDPILVSTLLCERDLEMGIRTMSSLARRSRRDVRFVVHEDGSLGAASIRALAEQRTAPIERVVDRRSADRSVGPALRGLPAAQALRDRQAYALKLLDIPLLSDGPVVYMDTDVLFLRDLESLPVASEAQPAVFMPDHQNAYALGVGDVARRATAVARRVNSGLFSVLPRVARPQAVDRILRLERPAYFRYPWFEQTAWSILALREGGLVMSESQVRVVRPVGPLDAPGLIAAHFVSGTRHRMEEVRDEPATIGAAAALALQPMRRLRPLPYAAELAGRRARRARSGT